MGNIPVKQVAEFNRTPGSNEHLMEVYWDNGEKIFKYRSPNSHSHDYDKYQYWKIKFPDTVLSVIIDGYLYNWYAATDVRNLAPAGWHVPSASEWETLKSYLGGQDVAGGKLKSAGSWSAPNTGATNETGFTAPAAGVRGFDGSFTDTTYRTVFLTSDGIYSNYVLDYLTDNLTMNTSSASGFSVRLIKDDSVLSPMTGNDGRVYKTVKIGTQVWMAENLLETKYRDGSSIDNVTDNSAWSALVTGARCAYNNVELHAVQDTIVEGDSLDVTSKYELIVQAEKGIELYIEDGKLRFSFNSFYTDNGTPYVDTISALSKIVSKNRYVGLTLNVNGTDYWFGSGIEDTDLVQKPFKAHSHSIGEVTGLQGEITTIESLISDITSVLNNKVNIVSGMGLSSNDFTSEEKVNLSKQSGTNSGDQTLDSLEGVKRPLESETNAVAVFTDPTGQEIKSSKLFVDEKGQVSNQAIPDENGFAVGSESGASGVKSYGKVGHSDNIPMLARNDNKSGSGERNTVTHENTLPGVIPDNTFALYEQFRFPHNRGGDPTLSLQGEKHIVKYTDVTSGSECTREEWWLLKGGVLSLAMWLDVDGLHTNNSQKQTIFTLTLPNASSVASRITGATFGTGAESFVLSVAGDSPNHLIITHNLNREIVDVKIKSTETAGITGKRLLIGSAPYSGIVATDNNTLRIENLTTVEKEITLHLIFA